MSPWLRFSRATSRPSGQAVREARRILRGLDWETTGRIASLMGAIKIAVRGTQNHTFTNAEFEARYASEFGQPLRAAS